MAFVFLSHKLNPTDLAWPGAAVLTIDEDDAIGKNGSPFNSVVNHIPDHFGTHFDAPLHFNPKGVPLHELPNEYFGYKGDEILLLDIPKKATETVNIEDIEPHKDDIAKAKLLLIRTGFSKVRREQPEVYQQQGPSLHPTMCRYMVENFPNLLCIGMDFLAIGSPCNDMAADAHQWLLGFHTDKFITAIEDMDLEPIGNSRIETLTLGPLRIIGSDSGQVSVMAELA